MSFFNDSDKNAIQQRVRNTISNVVEQGDWKNSTKEKVRCGDYSGAIRNEIGNETEDLIEFSENIGKNIIRVGLAFALGIYIA